MGVVSPGKPGCELLSSGCELLSQVVVMCHQKLHISDGEFLDLNVQTRPVIFFLASVALD
jgi:hypothetical protein